MRLDAVKSPPFKIILRLVLRVVEVSMKTVVIRGTSTERRMMSMRTVKTVSSVDAHYVDANKEAKKDLSYVKKTQSARRPKKLVL